MNPTLFVPGYIVKPKAYEFLPDLASKYTLPLYVHEREYSALLDERAADLKDHIRNLSAAYSAPVVCVGHSRGATDLTYTLHKYPMLADHVSAVISMAGPHRGSLIADLVKDPKCDLKMNALGFAVRYLDEAATLNELTTEFMGNLNVMPVEGVQYLSYVFYANKFKIVGPSNIDYFLDRNMASDSTVDVVSQKFGEVAEIIDADHKSQTLPIPYGWPVVRWFKRPYKSVWHKVFTRIGEL